MSVQVVTTTAGTLSSLITADVMKVAEPALVAAGQRIRQEIKTLFIKKPQGVRDGQGAEWKRTSRIAMQLRKTYPKGKGKKGLTQAQAQYLYSAPTLVDTGALRDSINVTQVTNKKDVVSVYIQDNKPYGKLHQKGGTTKIDGKTIVVPQRSFILLTGDDERRTNAIIEAAFK